MRVAASLHSNSWEFAMQVIIGHFEKFENDSLGKDEGHATKVARNPAIRSFPR
jgi:hypothetical protein